MIDLRKKDDMIAAIEQILQQEALKGNQHLIDKNKNNKVDPEDFKILRGEKKAVKEEETVDEGIKDVAKKAFKALTGGSDEDQRKDLQRKMGLPQTGKKPTPQKEEVVDESLLGQLRDRGNVATGQKQQDRKNFDTNTGAALKPNSTISGIRAKMQNKVQEEMEEVQGKTLKQFKEGWEEMMADVKKRAEPKPNGGSGVKQGSRYGGSKQKDTPEQDTEKK